MGQVPGDGGAQDTVQRQEFETSYSLSCGAGLSSDLSPKDKLCNYQNPLKEGQASGRTEHLQCGHDTWPCVHGSAYGSSEEV